MKSGIKRVYPLIAAISAMIILSLVFRGYFTFEDIKENSEILRLYAEEEYLFSVLLYILSYIPISFFLPGTIALTMAGGFLFGRAGFLYTVVGIAFGASLAFFSARYIIGNRVQRAHSEALKGLNEEIGKHGYAYMLFLRVSPIVPAFIVNFSAGLTKMPFRIFFWMTVLGILPGTAIYTLAGVELGAIGSKEDIMTWKLFVLFMALGVFTLLPRAFEYVKKRHKG